MRVGRRLITQIRAARPQAAAPIRLPSTASLAGHTCAQNYSSGITLREFKSKVADRDGLFRKDCDSRTSKMPEWAPLQMLQQSHHLGTQCTGDLSGVAVTEAIQENSHGCHYGSSVRPP